MRRDARCGAPDRTSSHRPGSAQPVGLGAAAREGGRHSLGASTPGQVSPRRGRKHTESIPSRAQLAGSMYPTRTWRLWFSPTHAAAGRSRVGTPLALVLGRPAARLTRACQCRREEGATGPAPRLSPGRAEKRLTARGDTDPIPPHTWARQWPGRGRTVAITAYRGLAPRRGRARANARARPARRRCVAAPHGRAEHAAAAESSPASVPPPALESSPRQALRPCAACGR